MSNSFNPFPPPAAPAQPQAAPVAPPQTPQRTIARDLDDQSMYDGFTTPFFRHLEGEFDLKITGYSGARTEKLGRACHISFEVVKSSKPDAIPVGSTWRIAYKYDFERSEKSDLDTYGSDARTLGLFVQALFNRKQSPEFSTKAAEQSLHKHDWVNQPGYIHLSATLGKEKPNKSGSLQRYRNDLWLPVIAG
jgi:hypothetical protein